MELKDFFPMYEAFNRKYGLKLRYSSPKRDALLERCCEFRSVSDITKLVLEGGADIDATLRNIIRAGKPAQSELEFTAEVAVEETTKEDKPMENTNNFGTELQNLFMATLAKMSVEKIVESVMPQIEKKILDEYGMKPVRHEIAVGESAPVSIDGELPPVFDDILTSAMSGNSVMMTGPAGTGKGFMARQVAKVLGAEFYEVNAVSDKYGLTGFVDANSQYVSTPFYDACKAVAEGRKAVFLLDEMDCSDAEALKTFNEALEAKVFTFPNDERIDFKDLVIMSACNTFGTGADDKYVANRIDESTLNRFTPIPVDYSRKVEMALAGGDEQIVDFIDIFRNQVNKSGLSFVVSYRNIKQIQNVKNKMELRKVMKYCLVKSMGDDDLRSVLENIADVMANNPYYRATKGENVKLTA